MKEKPKKRPKKINKAGPKEKILNPDLTKLNWN